MNENAEITHWQCPKCNQLVELDYEICWNCQYEKTGKEKMLSNEQISNEVIEEEKIVKKEIPKSPIALNILGAIAILGYFKNIFGMDAYGNIDMVINIVSLTLALVGFIAIIWMKKWGLYLYTAICVLGYISSIQEEHPMLLIFQIIPTIVVIWGFMNLKKMT